MPTRFLCDVFETFLGERRTHIVVGKDAAIVARGSFIQFDLVILDSGGLDLLSNPLFHVACGLTYLEETFVRSVINRIGVDARLSFGLGRDDFIDGLSHPHSSH